jgi:hypothetical protein
MGWQLLPKTRIGRSTAFSQAFPPSGTEQHEDHQSPVTATTYAAACRNLRNPKTDGVGFDKFRRARVKLQLRIVTTRFPTRTATNPIKTNSAFQNWPAE